MMPIPPPPKPGETRTHRAIGWTTKQRSKGRRQVRWEANETSHTDHPAVLAFEDGQRFECTVVYTYTGDDPRDPFKQTGPRVENVLPLEPFVYDPVRGQALWDSVMRGVPLAEPDDPNNVDESFWLRK